jgi:hypothetical protein
MHSVVHREWGYARARKKCRASAGHVGDRYTVNGHSLVAQKRKRKAPVNNGKGKAGCKLDVWHVPPKGGFGNADALGREASRTNTQVLLQLLAIRVCCVARATNANYRTRRRPASSLLAVAQIRKPPFEAHARLDAKMATLRLSSPLGSPQKGACPPMQKSSGN